MNQQQQLLPSVVSSGVPTAQQRLLLALTARAKGNPKVIRKIKAIKERERNFKWLAR